MKDTSGFPRLAWSNLAAQSAEQIGLAATPLVAVLALGAGVVIMEGLTNLAALPRRRVEFAAPFYKIAGTEGAPARFFATV